VPGVCCSSAPPYDQRKEVNPATRTQMIAISRWAERNSPLYKQCLDEAVMVIVGDGLMAQSQASNPETATAHSKYFADWCKNCDVTGRFTFGQVQAMWQRGCFGDGDSWGVLTMVNDQPKVQVLEAHRVGTPREEIDSKCVDGVYLGRFGEAVGYNVYTDDDAKNRYIPAGSMNPRGRFRASVRSPWLSNPTVVVQLGEGPARGLRIGETCSAHVGGSYSNPQEARRRPARRPCREVLRRRQLL